jgi:PAS domain S-box-containing protein
MREKVGTPSAASTVETPESTLFSLERWRENFLDVILRASTILGLAVAVISAVDVVRAGNAWLAWVYIAAWLVVLALAVRAWPYHLRAWTLLALMYGLAVAGLMENGVRGDARLFFLSLTIMTAMLVNVRAAVAVTITCLVTILAVGVLAFGGLVHLTSPVTPLGTVRLWIVSTLSLALLQTIVLVGLLLLLREFSSAQQKLRESFDTITRERTLLRTVVDNIPDAIYAKDGEGRRSLSNRADARLMDTHNDAESLGRTGAELLPSEAANRLLEEDRLVFRTGQPLINREFPMTGPDGRERWLLVSKLPLRGPGGEIMGMVGIDRDITDLRKAEDDRARLAEQLRQSQRMESMGRLAGSLAHDINNLLTPLLGYSETLLEIVDSREELTEGLAQVKGAAHRTRDLLRQLLAFGGRQSLTLAPVDLRETLRGFDKLLRRTVRADITLDVHLPAGLGTIRADAGALEQVILNLVLNAQDAMPNGGRLSIELADREAPGRDGDSAPATLPAGPYVVLTVADSGVGMDEATLARVFEPFFTTKPRGTGLGLATVYGLVQQHEGTVAVTSHPGRGTTVQVWFPGLRDDAGGRLSSGGAAASAAPGGSETILVVEDDDVVLDLACRVLSRKGYTVLAARGGPEALARAAAAPVIDLLLSDVVMPGMSGPDLARQLSAARPQMRAVFMSGYTADMLADNDVGDAGEELVRKPFLPEDLARAVRRALDSSPRR